MRDASGMIGQQTCVQGGARAYCVLPDLYGSYHLAMTSWLGLFALIGNESWLVLLARPPSFLAMIDFYWRSYD